MSIFAFWVAEAVKNMVAQPYAETRHGGIPMNCIQTTNNYSNVVKTCFEETELLKIPF